MTEQSGSRFHPMRWTALSWFAALYWGWIAFAGNYASFTSYPVDDVTGELLEPTHYKSFAELPYPVGWPLYYVRPSYLTPSPAPMSVPVGTPAATPPAPAPSGVYPWVFGVSMLLVAVAIASLIYFLQKTMYRFSLFAVFAVMVALPVSWGLGRLIVMLFGIKAIFWYRTAIYFLPVPAALAARFELIPAVDWKRWRSVWKGEQEPHAEYDSAEDALAAASKLEKQGNWLPAIDLFQQVAERWPEHREYALSCVDRVDEKRLPD